MFGKAIDDISAADLQALVDNRTPEGRGVRSSSFPSWPTPPIEHRASLLGSGSGLKGDVCGEVVLWVARWAGPASSMLGHVLREI